MTFLKSIVFTGFALIALVSGATATAQTGNGGPTVASFDHGALDTLIELGLADKVVAVPLTGLPDYLSGIAQGRTDVGNLKTPDLKAVRGASPELILVTGRQSKILENLQAIAKIRNVSLARDDYQSSVTEKVMGLAALYGRESVARDRLDELWGHIKRQREAIPNDPKVVVVTHNNGHFSMRREPVVFELLGLQEPALPGGVKPVTRGARVFVPVTPEVMAKMTPDALLIVDRSAAIGDDPMDLGGLSRALRAAGSGAPVTVLDPGLWYLSGAGLQSIKLQVDEVIKAITLQ